ncbi:MAG: hypothetical protein R3313_04920, partial [Candidatus Saccharimonadales bacterium]|nr:hypothetical protein [Candidatus Saccharimonadales bacterium]
SHLGGPLYELEVDHSLEGIIPEFTVYADEANPYGGAATQAEFEDVYGVFVTYDEVEMTWVIDFGPFVTHTLFVPGGITFYIEVLATDGHQFGDMFDVQPEYTFAYTFDVLEP